MKSYIFPILLFIVGCVFGALAYDVSAIAYSNLKETDYRPFGSISLGFTSGMAFLASGLAYKKA